MTVILALCRLKSKILQFMVILELLTNNSYWTSNKFLSLVEGNDSHSPDGLSDEVCPLIESKCQISSEFFITASD